MSYFYYQSKRIYYEETGDGKPVIFLHGNTASSRMFEPLLPLYAGQVRVILIDFLGHGRSDRLTEFPVELWYEEALQTIALIEHLKYDKVSLFGTSGGAFAAVQAGLLRPDLVDRVIADSFEGRSLGKDFSKNVIEERAMAVSDESSSEFYRWCQGDDWKHVVDCDTRSLVQFADQQRPLYCRPLSEFARPLLLVGSMEDQMVGCDLRNEYEEIQKENTQTKVCLFETGGHPAVYTNAEGVAEAVLEFLRESEEGIE